MGSNRINLLFRFLLELAALGAMGFWGWQKGEGIFGIILALTIPIFVATIWGVFAVPNDPSRSGKAPVPISGVLRLIIELLIFAVSIWMVFNLGYSLLGRLFGVAVVTHYLLSMDRIVWLTQKPRKED